MSARWSSKAGFPISTKPASSAPWSRASCRSRSASIFMGVRTSLRTGSGVATVMSPLFVYASIRAKKSLGVGRLDPLDGSVKQPQAVIPQELLGFRLSLLPGRNRLFHQAFSLIREPEGVGATVLVGQDFEPAVLHHPVHG